MTDTDDQRPGDTPGDQSRAGAPGNETKTRLESINDPADTQRLLAGRYRLESLLGRGSMGAVWKAQDVVLGRSVAVKEVLLPPTQTDDENQVARERALREARSIAALSHPNVVTLYDVVEDDGRPWVVMELVPAKSLAQILRDDGTLPPTEAARIGVAVLAALQSAHEVGITHRDVKPGNILVSPDGRVKLADFGISRRAEDSQLTRTGLMVGSPSYIAPEVARGREAGPAADIWGLGATLQCAVEGSPPFDLGDPVATLTAVVGDPPRPALKAGPLQPLLTRMLDKDPRSRIRTDELRSALESVAARRPGPTPTYAPPTGPLAPTSGPMPAPAGPRPAQTAYTQGPRPPLMHGMPPGPGTGHFRPPQQPYGTPGTGYHPTPPAEKPKRKAWIPAVIGVLVVALIAGGLVWFLSTRKESNNKGSDTTGSDSSTSINEPPTTTGPPPTTAPSSNNTTFENGKVSGAIKVNGEFRPFSFKLPEDWKVLKSDDGRSDFILTSGGEKPETMVKLTVVAELLNYPNVDQQIQSQIGDEGSPATLPGYSEIDYKVTGQGNVLWQYANTYKGAERRGYFYAAKNGDGILWKIITSGPANDSKSTGDVANGVIKSFQA